jgi:hypothetical protein
MRSMLWVLAIVAFAASSASGQSLPPQITAVQKYILEKDYPEVFGKTDYKTKVQNAVIADLDGDGQAEVIIHYTPHFRQSPPVVIYRVAPDLAVTRVKEGLAPGPLVPLTGAYLDSHTLGEATDLDLGGQQGDANARRKFVEAAMGQFGNVVEYTTFFHVDSRVGPGTYVDMTELATPPKTKTCADFEFSPVRQVSAGSISALGKGNVLAAWAGGKVYLYRIKSFLPSGLLDKESWVVNVLADFGGFASGAGGPLHYLAASGAEKLFAVQCQDHQCTQTP